MDCHALLNYLCAVRSSQHEMCKGFIVLIESNCSTILLEAFVGLFMGLVLAQNHTDAEQVAVTSNDEVSQQLDVLVMAVTSLSRWVEATEECQKGERLHTLVAPPPLFPDGGPATGDP